MTKKERSNEYRKANYSQIKIEIKKDMAIQIKENAKKENISMPKYIMKCIEFYERSKNE